MGKGPPELDLARAQEVVSSVLPPTPLLWDPDLSACLEREVLLKLESLQVTGSFKVRGALVRLSALSPDERRAGVVACSSGNHGRAVAWAAHRLDVDAVVCVPSWVDPVKRSAMEALGARVRLVGDSYDQAEAAAVALAAGEGRVLIHPFDDPLVVAGQATVATELLVQCPSVQEVLVPLSGGGLVGGVAWALERAGKPGSVTAVSARRARVMRASLEAGRPVELPEEETLASALAGGIGLDNRVSFPLVRDLVHRHLEVGESAIGRAMSYAFRSRALLVEGGGAVALAAALSGLLASGGGPAVVVVSGGNVDLSLATRVLAAGGGAG